MRGCKSLCTVFLAVPAGIAMAQPASSPPSRMEVSQAHAASAQSLLKRCEEIRVKRLEGVKRYVVDQSIMNNRALVMFERVEVRGADGRTYPAFRQSRGNAGLSGRADRPPQEGGRMSSDDLRLFGRGAQEVGRGVAKEMEAAGFPPALMGGGSPWASTDPRVMMGGASTFLNAAADAQEQNEAEEKAAAGVALRSVNDMAEVARRARIVGTEKVLNRDAYHLQAKGLKRVLPAEDGREVTVNDVSLWIDKEHCVPLKTRIEGVARAEGKEQPMVIERLDRDYRAVPGSGMYEPFRQVTSMTMKGMVTAEEQGKLQEAKRQLEQMEAQLGQLPPAQRETVMARFKPQIEMVKRMADGEGGGVSVLTKINAIHVNPDPATIEKLGSAGSVGPGSDSPKAGKR